MSLWNAKSVNPDTVTSADIAEIAAEFNIRLGTAPLIDFFQPGQTYRRNGDTFRCAAVGLYASGSPNAIGCMPIYLAGEATWEFMVLTAYDWTRGWKVEA